MDISNFDIVFPEDQILEEIFAKMSEDIPPAEMSEDIPPSRFKNMTSDEIISMRQKSVNTNTAKSTNTWYNAYKNWAYERNMREDIENIPPLELNLILERFYAELRTKDGKEYEPECLAVMQSSLDRYLKERNYPTSIVRGNEFHTSNITLKGKATQLREDGKGSRPNASKPLTREEEDELWRSGKLGADDPQTLLHTVWHILTQHLGFRGRQEHKIAEINEFHFGTDENKVEFIEYNDCKPTKTRPGSLRSKRRPQRPRMYATGTDRCPIAIFQKYISHRPESQRTKGPLFLSIIYNPTTEVWYKNQSMGANRIGEIMKRIVAGTSFEGTKRLTNHSGRKTLVKKLDDAEVPREKIIAVTGHRNEKSLDDYVDSMNHNQSKQLSNIISGNSTSSSNQVSLPGPSHEETPVNISFPTCEMSSSFPAIHLTGISANSTVNINFNNSCNTSSAAATASSFSQPPFLRLPYKRIRPVIDSDDEYD